jgi:hypothetical protein
LGRGRNFGISDGQSLRRHLDAYAVAERYKDLVFLAPFVTGDHKVIECPRPFGFVNIRFRPVRHFKRPAPGSRADFLKRNIGTVNIDRPPDAGGINPTETEEVVFYLPLKAGNKGDKNGILPLCPGSPGGRGNILRKQDGVKDQEKAKKEPAFLHLIIIIGRNEFSPDKN